MSLKSAKSNCFWLDVKTWSWDKEFYEVEVSQLARVMQEVATKAR